MSFLLKQLGGENLPVATPGDQMIKVRDDVARLLNHAVKQPTISIKPEFLQQTVPLLCRDAKDLSPADNVILWNAYNQLSILLSPVTADSLQVDEELNTRLYDGATRRIRLWQLRTDLWLLLAWMFLFVLSVFVTQAYSLMVSNTNEGLATLSAEQTKIVAEENLARKAGAAADEHQEPLRSILDKKKSLEAQMTLSVQRQCELTDWIHKIFFEDRFDTCASFYPPPTSRQDTSPAAPLDTPPYPFESRAAAVSQSSKAIELMLNSLILPLLLGFLGAIAFLTRNTLNHLNDYTFTPSWAGRYIMRVLLGGLLGVVGPWLYASGKVEEVGLGLSLFSFLLGYSVELAFSVFDRFITYARDSIRPSAKPAQAGAQTASVVAEAPGAATVAAAANTSVSPNAEVANLKPQVDDIRNQLLEIVSLQPALQSVTLPEYYLQECAPKIELARGLLQRLDAAQQGAATDPLAFAKAFGSVSEQIGTITAENHPLTVLLGSARRSFAAASLEGMSGNAEPSRIETFIVALFAGAIAAFAQGSSAYERWQAYVWARPFIARLTSGIDFDEQDAQACLKSTSIFLQAFKNRASSVAKPLLDLAVSPENSEALAQRLWQTPGELGDLASLFGDIEVFAEGWDEYRHCLLRHVLQKVDFPNDRFGNDETQLSVSETLSVIDVLRQDKTAEKDLDILCHLSLILMRQSQTSASFDAVGLIRNALKGVAP